MLIGSLGAANTCRIQLTTNAVSSVGMVSFTITITVRLCHSAAVGFFVSKTDDQHYNLSIYNS